MPWCIVAVMPDEETARRNCEQGQRVVMLPDEVLAVGPSGKKAKAEPCGQCKAHNHDWCETDKSGKTCCCDRLGITAEPHNHPLSLGCGPSCPQVDNAHPGGKA